MSEFIEGQCVNCKGKLEKPYTIQAKTKECMELLFAERNRLTADLHTAKMHLIDDIEMISRLKAEAEEINELSELRLKSEQKALWNNLELVKDRDAWKAKAEKIATEFNRLILLHDAPKGYLCKPGCQACVREAALEGVENE